MDLGVRIALWRKAKGMSRQALADAVGVTPAAVYQWEDEDGTTPSVPNLEKIVAALGISMGRFYKAPPKARGGAS